MEDSICKESFSLHFIIQVKKLFECRTNTIIHFCIYRKFFSRIDKENIQFPVLFFQTIVYFIFLQTICFLCQPLYPVSFNRCFKIAAAGAKACLQPGNPINLFICLKGVKYPKRRIHKTLPAIEQLLNLLPAFKPLVFTQSKMLSHQLQVFRYLIKKL